MFSDGSANSRRRKLPRTNPAGPSAVTQSFRSSRKTCPTSSTTEFALSAVLLMDRHSACSLCPFCGDPEPMTTMLVNIIGQTDAESGNPLVALYFSKTTEVRGDNMDVVSDWVARVGYAETTPSRKAAVQLLDNGNYHSVYGHIANPTDGDYSSGALNRSQPENRLSLRPRTGLSHAGSIGRAGLPKVQATVPELACIRLRGEWWIVDRDRERSMVQQSRGPFGRGQPQPHHNQRRGCSHCRPSGRGADRGTP